MGRKSSKTDEQIIQAWKEVDAGAKPADVCRKLGVSEQTFYRGKAKYGGMDVSDAKRLKQLEDENRRLKGMVADQALDIQQVPLLPSLPPNADASVAVSCGQSASRRDDVDACAPAGTVVAHAARRRQQ